MNFEDLFIETEFLQPLTKSEFYEHMMKVKQGDLIAREKVITHNIKLVLSRVITKFDNTPYEKKDLVSIGLVGLIKAVDGFDISTNYSFSTYAVKCIDNEILEFLRKGSKSLETESLDAPINEEDQKIKLIHTIKSDINIEDDYTDAETCQSLRMLVNDLPERDKEVIMMGFGFYDDYIYTQQEIGKKLNLSQGQVSKLTATILTRLRYQLKQQGLFEEKENIIKRKSLSGIK